MKNQKLLWHGSRITNWVGILSQGLKIAPPEAPKTGYMFGKVWRHPLSSPLHFTYVLRVSTLPTCAQNPRIIVTQVRLNQKVALCYAKSRLVTNIS